jgi:hypothetical protein
MREMAVVAQQLGLAIANFLGLHLFKLLASDPDNDT